MQSLSREILQSARIAELKRAAALAHSRLPIQLPRNPKRKSTRLLVLLAAERRRNAALIEAMARD